GGGECGAWRAARGGDRCWTPGFAISGVSARSRLSCQSSRMCQASALPKTTTDYSSNPQHTIVPPPTYPPKDLAEASDPAGEWGRPPTVGQDLSADSQGIQDGIQDLHDDEE
ncbi:unnamed protein product, partial [Laminaria digitata]